MFVINTMTSYGIPMAYGVSLNVRELTIPGYSRPVKAGDYWPSFYCQ